MERNEPLIVCDVRMPKDSHMCRVLIEYTKVKCGMRHVALLLHIEQCTVIILMRSITHSTWNIKIIFNLKWCVFTI